jgi:hypothetical protein
MKIILHATKISIHGYNDHLIFQAMKFMCVGEIVQCVCLNMTTNLFQLLKKSLKHVSYQNKN